MPGCLNNLGNSYRCCFERSGKLSDISEAISLQQRAVELTTNGHTDMSMYLNNLRISYECRFGRTGELSDISAAISAQQRAVQLTANGHGDMPGHLNNLGISYRRRFERRGDLSDISEAISAQKRAVQITPNGHVDVPLYLNNLGNSYLCRFEHTSELSDISEAILAQQQAVELTPSGHANMPVRLNNLGVSFFFRFKRTGNFPDIEEAISLRRRAIQLTPDGHADMPGWLNNLGNSYQCRFEHTGDLSDIEGAIAAQQRAVELTPDGHAQMPARLNNLGVSYQCRFNYTNNPTDIHTTLSLYQKSATTFGPPSTRLHAAQKWAQPVSVTHDLAQSLAAYAVIIDLISQIAGMDRTIEQRHSHLTKFSMLATSAASAALAQGEINKALEWLEQGRCLVWSQLHQLRTPVDSLRDYDERLAQRFMDTSSALELSGSRRGLENLTVDAPLSQRISLQDEAHSHIKLASEWNQLLDEIRCIPAFHDFLRPPQTSDLLKGLPPDGPVILINVHETRCDALALISGFDAPVHIPLNNFTHKLASELRECLRLFLLSRRVLLRDEDRGPRPVFDENIEMQSEIHFILEELWQRVVKPILDGLGYSGSVSLSIPNISFC